MRKLTLIAALLIVGGGAAAGASAATAQPAPYGGWQGDDDDVYTCAAIGCREGDYERYPEYAPQPIDAADPDPEAEPAPYSEPAPDREGIGVPHRYDPTADILKRLADEPLPALSRGAPREEPASEDRARQGFYRAIREHADGAGSLEEVEAAYRHLLPYRR
jgi:hypothetical protein